VRWLYLGPSENNVYFADHQLDANNVTFMRGASGKVFAEDRAGTFAISAAGPIDARLLRVIAPFPALASAATLAASDSEIWWYDTAANALHFENVADRIGTLTLGVREQPARPIEQYHFTHLVADPVRGLLYGLDPDAAAVVAIDRGSLQPTGAVIVGSGPSDLDVDPTGTFLYVAHQQTQGVAQIRLDTFSFVKFLVAFRDGFDIATVGAHLVATIDRDQYVSASLYNLDTGTRSDFGAGGFEAAIAATADGLTFFAGSSQISGVSRYSVAGAQFVLQATSNQTFAGPARSLTITPNGDGVYYGGYFLDGATLSVRRYPMPDTIRTVTTDGRLAISATTVYRVSDGTAVGSLTTAGAVQAASPDGRTLYVATSTGIAAVDLSGF
jgi:DNA-binding beta-propeller fold protein YncE